MKGKLRRAGAITCYGLAVLVLAFYLVTLYRGLHPHTSRGYEEFYSGQELYTWPGSNGIEIQSGQVIHFDSDRGADGQGAGHILRRQGITWREADGWSYVDGQGYCITGWKAPLLFLGRTGRTYSGHITLAAPQAGGEVTLLANGEQVAFAQFPSEEQTIEFETPALGADGRLLLEIALGGDIATPVAVKELILT